MIALDYEIWRKYLSPRGKDLDRQKKLLHQLKICNLMRGGKLTIDNAETLKRLDFWVGDCFTKEFVIKCFNKLAKEASRSS